MMDRWLQRWDDNIKRYQNLECVKLILPWSTANMRFCTSEMKVAICCRDLVARFPGQTILSVSGIRREESTTRAKAAVCSPQQKLRSKTQATSGYNWNPLLPWTTEQVYTYHRDHDFSLHEGYGRGLSRISCAFCILSSLADLTASATDPRNHDIYHEMVDLEVASAFSFQSNRWLADVAAHLLTESQLTASALAKRKAKAREGIEAAIPGHLEYVRGWPTVMPTRSEAVMLSEVRRSIAELYSITISYSDPDAILARYEALMEERKRKGIVVKTARVLPVQQALWEGEQ
jgi:3'-phosphoadenosine 5'-phosphosulfate sulfotransferase (PAPS reductase)/FAD synthetase